MIHESVSKQIKERGFADLGIVDPEIRTCDLISEMGMLERISGLDPIQVLTPKREEESTPNAYSGQYGLGGFPLHTDLAHWYSPPRYFLLRCIVPADSVATKIVHKREALAGIPDESARRALFKPRRRLNGRLSLLRFQQDELIRWDTSYIVPANDEAHEVHGHLTSLNENREIGSEVILRDAGHSVIIDNWNSVHSRSKVEGAATKRVIERAYLKELRDW